MEAGVFVCRVVKFCITLRQKFRASHFFVDLAKSCSTLGLSGAETIPHTEASKFTDFSLLMCACLSIFMETNIELSHDTPSGSHRPNREQSQ
jgi:hypothetical protein